MRRLVWDDFYVQAKNNVKDFGIDWDLAIDQAKISKSNYEENIWLPFYTRYQKTEKWKKLRESVILKSNGKCVDCGGSANSCHHLNYDYVDTPREEGCCVALCSECHMKRHNLKNGANERPVFIGECYFCHNLEPIYRVDSWRGKKLEDGHYIKGGWTFWCNNCGHEWIKKGGKWIPNRQLNYCPFCMDSYIGRKNQHICNNCIKVERGFYEY